MNRRGFLGATLGLIATPMLAKIAAHRLGVILPSPGPDGQPTRLLDAAHGDRARVWLDGQEVTENACMALTAEERGVEIDGAVCLYDLNTQGQVFVRNGEAARFWRYGRVRWEPVEAT